MEKGIFSAYPAIICVLESQAGLPGENDNQQMREGEVG